MEVLFVEKLYVGFKGGELCLATNQECLERVIGTTVRVSFDISYCPEHDHILLLPSSFFHVRAAQKAKNCEEYKLYRRIWDVGWNLGEAVVSGDPGEVSEALRKLKRHQLERLLKLPEDALNFILALSERGDPKAHARLVARLTELKLRGGCGGS